MKKTIFGSLVLIGAFLMASCEKVDHAQSQKITYYPTLELSGASSIIIDKGSTFTDPGYYAEMQGLDVTDQVEISSNVNTNASGIYTVTYTIVNEDGFSASASRTVIVLDPSDAVEGIYTVDPSSYRLYNGSQVAYGRAFQIIVIGEGGGKYAVDDLLAGWYCQRAGYGSNYAMPGHIQVDASGTITLLDSLVPGWNDSAEGMTDGKFDAATSTISYDLEYTSYPFHFVVTMTKN